MSLRTFELCIFSGEGSINCCQKIRDRGGLCKVCPKNPELQGKVFIMTKKRMIELQTMDRY